MAKYMTGIAAIFTSEELILKAATKTKEMGFIKFDVISLRRIQQLWTSHLQGLGNSIEEFNLPVNIATAIDEINEYIASVMEVSNMKNE